MIAPVRKFQVEYNGQWLPVFYIFEPSDSEGSSVSYCVADKAGKPILVPGTNVTGIRDEDDTALRKKKSLEEILPNLRKNSKKRR